ncbi:MAG: HlyD family efflux transporter periplasmic adaptor subunit [Bacteroidetes bacterium]|nr:HlyD family efflux transporter periplasmic adaptor subunit [Bacteroidota bacterium]
MNTRLIFYSAFLMVLFSCSGKGGKSDAYGTFEATEVTISAEVPGKLVYINMEEGQEIAAGTMVALIDTTDLYLKKRALEYQQKAVSSKLTGISAQVAVQEQQKENLVTDRNRLEKLFKDKAATQKQMDDISGSLKLIDKQIQATQVQREGVVNELEGITQQIAQLNESLRKCHIINPIRGTVLGKFAESNELATMGKPLYKIADLQEMYLRIYVSGDQLPHIRLGQETEVMIDEDKTSNRKLTGTISWISSTAEFTPKIIQTKEERVNLVYAVKVRVKNDGSLKIAMPGEVNFK